MEGAASPPCQSEDVRLDMIPHPMINTNTYQMILTPQPHCTLRRIALMLVNMLSCEPYAISSSSHTTASYAVHTLSGIGEFVLRDHNGIDMSSNTATPLYVEQAHNNCTYNALPGDYLVYENANTAVRVVSNFVPPPPPSPPPPSSCPIVSGTVIFNQTSGYTYAYVPIIRATPCDTVFAGIQTQNLTIYTNFGTCKGKISGTGFRNGQIILLYPNNGYLIKNSFPSNAVTVHYDLG